MADSDKKISEITPISIATAPDMFVMVDTSSGYNRRITFGEMMGSPGPIGGVNPSTGEFTTIQLSSGSIVNQISTDGAFGAAADNQISTALAIKTYVDDQISAFTTQHNDLLGIQGGDSTSSEYYHLTKDIHDGLYSGSPIIGLGSEIGTKFEVDYGSHEVTLEINGNPTAIFNSSGFGLTAGTTINEFSTDTTLSGDSDNAVPTERAVKTYVDLQVGNVPLEHNNLLSIQGGDSTAEFYHFTQEIHDQVGSTPTAITLSGGLKIDGHSAIGEADIDYPGWPTYSALLRLVETFDASITGAGIGLSVSAESLANDGFARLTGIAGVAQNDTSILHHTIMGGDFFANAVTPSGTVTDVIGIKGHSAAVADNAVVTNSIGGDFYTDSGWGISNSTVTNMMAGRFQVLFMGSGDIDISDAYGILIKAPGFNSTGATDNLYGLYVEDQAPGGFSSTYNIYSAGGNSKNKFEGDVYVDGNLFIDGTAFVVHNQEVTTADNIITLNYGEVGAGVTAGQAGVEIDRGLEIKYQFLFVELDDAFKIGEVGDLQAVATREDSPINRRYPYWNSAQRRLDTVDSPLSFDATTLILVSDLEVSGDIYANNLNVSGDVKADGLELQSGPKVNSISSNDSLGTSDTTIPTQGAVKSYVDSQSGSGGGGETGTETGNLRMSNGDTTASIIFEQIQDTEQYSVAYSIVNEVDNPPLLFAHTIFEKRVDGFRVMLSGPVDSDNYFISWIVANSHAGSSSSSSSSSSSG